MKNTHITLRSVGTTNFVLGSLLALCACTSSQPAAPASEPTPAPAAAPAAAATPRTGQAQVTNEFFASAQVMAIDAAQRLITLRREDGEFLQIKAGEEVRNFAQIAVGDKLRVKYAESLRATLLPAGAGAQAAEGVLAAGRAEAGAKPAGALGYAITVRVKIESIDRERDLVVFSMESGELVTHRIATPEGRKFVSGLKVGDAVQLDYSEGLALSIEKT